MGNKAELNCGLEGQPGFCPIAKAGNGCRQVIECFDANLTPGEITPAEFVQRIPIETTVDKVALLRAKLVADNPRSQINQTPLRNILAAVEAGDKDMTPEDFVERLKVDGLTAEKANELRVKHIMNNPSNPTPLASIIVSMENLRTSRYAEMFLARALNGGEPMDNLFDPARPKVVFELKPKIPFRNEGIGIHPLAQFPTK